MRWIQRPEQGQMISLPEWRIRLCKSHSTQVRIFRHTTHQTSSLGLERAAAFLFTESFSLAADNKMFRLIMKRVRSKRDRVRAGSAFSWRREENGGRRHGSLLEAGSKPNWSKSKTRTPEDVRLIPMTEAALCITVSFLSHYFHSSCAKYMTGDLSMMSMF